MPSKAKALTEAIPPALFVFSAEVRTSVLPGEDRGPPERKIRAAAQIEGRSSRSTQGRFWWFGFNGGDGKIFVYNVTRVVKIRTGEEDFAALQDVE